VLGPTIKPSLTVSNKFISKKVSEEMLYVSQLSKNNTEKHSKLLLRIKKYISAICLQVVN
jgi:hypothetical protein